MNGESDPDQTQQGRWFQSWKTQKHFQTAEPQPPWTSAKVCVWLMCFLLTWQQSQTVREELNPSLAPPLCGCSSHAPACAASLQKNSHVWWVPWERTEMLRRAARTTRSPSVCSVNLHNPPFRSWKSEEVLRHGCGAAAPHESHMKKNVTVDRLLWWSQRHRSPFSLINTRRSVSRWGEQKQSCGPAAPFSLSCTFMSRSSDNLSCSLIFISRKQKCCISVNPNWCCVVLLAVPQKQ